MCTQTTSITYRRMTPEDLAAAAAIEASVLDGWSERTLALTLACPTSHCFVAVEQAPAEGEQSLQHAPCNNESMGNNCSPIATAEQHNGDGVHRENRSRVPTPAVLCGFCACSLVGDTANLDAVSVAAPHRRRGVGRSLVQHAMRALAHAGAAQLWLEARSQNASALALYAALGFVQNGTRRGFYQHPADDAVLMTACLNDTRATNKVIAPPST